MEYGLWGLACTDALQSYADSTWKSRLPAENIFSGICFRTVSSNEIGLECVVQ